ncbi:MAG: type II secretion system protein M [SAR324 cluster bacterium]|nr:type II secretion system protein M [SAR324 cluster bacterium]
MELNQREKTWIIAAIVIFLPLLFFRFALLPLNEYLQNQRLAISRLEDKIQQINTLGQELKHLAQTRRSQSAPLSKRIDRLLRQQQLKSRSGTIINGSSDDRQRLVLNLKEVNLTELVKIMFSIENTSPVIAIESIDINPAYQNKKRFRLSSALSSW